MVIRHVNVKTSALWLCLGHCLTDGSQLVGLLFGEEDEFHDITVYDAVLCKKEPNCDREFGCPEVRILDKLPKYAKEMSEKHGRSMHCVGWYHSHPGYTCEPTMNDFHMLKEFCAQLGPDFLFMIFSVFLNEDKVRFAKYPVHSDGMLLELDFQSRRRQKGIVPGKKIEFLAVKLIDPWRLSIVPTFITKDPHLKHPGCLEAMCKFPAQLFKEKKRHFDCELNDLESSAVNEKIAAICKLNMRADSNMKLLQITADLYAPLMKLLDDKTSESSVKQNKLKFLKRQLEDDVKRLRALLNLERG